MYALLLLCTQCLKIIKNVSFYDIASEASLLVNGVPMTLAHLFLDLESDLYFFIFHYTVFHGASKMLQDLQSSGEMKDLTFVIVFV